MAAPVAPVAYDTIKPEVAEELDLKTPQFDARFPNQNQAKSCWQNFIDYQRCIKAKGDEYEPCNVFFRNYRSLCPEAWVEKWNDAIEEGNFQGRI